MGAQGTAEVVLVAFDRPGAEALTASAEVGLEGAPEDTVDVEAGWKAKEALDRALHGDVEQELVTISAGLVALDSLFSHDPEVIVVDEDGTGVLSADDYRNLHAMYFVLRGGAAEPDVESLRRRVRDALDRGHAVAATLDANDELNGVDDRLDVYAEEVVRDLTRKEGDDGNQA